MKRFVEGEDRSQSTLFSERLEDWISEDNPVRMVDVYVDELELGGLGFGRAKPRLVFNFAPQKVNALAKEGAPAVDCKRPAKDTHN